MYLTEHDTKAISDLLDLKQRGLESTADTLASVVDAAIIAKQCDASMLVLAADNSSRKLVKDVVARLKTANPNFLGVVLNKVPIKNSFYGKYYGNYYGVEEI